MDKTLHQIHKSEIMLVFEQLDPIGQLPIQLLSAAQGCCASLNLEWPDKDDINDNVQHVNIQHRASQHEDRKEDL